MHEVGIEHNIHRPILHNVHRQNLLGKMKLSERFHQLPFLHISGLFNFIDSKDLCHMKRHVECHLFASVFVDEKRLASCVQQIL